MTGLILASSSPVRAHLLRDAGVAFAVEPARVDEDAVKQSMLAAKHAPRAIADALAELKALRISLKHPGLLVLGADQVLEFENRLLSKSQNLEEARLLLQRLRGKPHHLMSALVLAKDGATIWRHVEKSTLTMRNFSDDFLDGYLAAEGEELLASVGGYRLEGRGVQLFSKIDGDYFAILGLPLIPLLSALREHCVLAS